MSKKNGILVAGVHRVAMPPEELPKPAPPRDAGSTVDQNRLNRDFHFDFPNTRFLAQY
jgi:hypothetical protein